MNVTEQKRDSFLDFAKGLLIILVILGHAIQYGSGSVFLNEGLYWDNWLMKVIYSFHMPLFMLISGYLTYWSFERKGKAQALFMRVKTLILPVAVWAPVEVLIQFYFGGGTISLRALIYAFLTDFWFLWAVIIGTVYLFVSLIVSEKHRAWFYAISLIGALGMPDILWGHAHKFVVVYFVAGYQIAAKKNDYRVSGGWLWVLVYAALMLIYNKNSYIYTTLFSVWGKRFGVEWAKQLWIDSYRYAVGFAGCFAMMFLWEKLWNFVHKSKLISLILLWLGRDSLSIYILSNYMFKYTLPALTENMVPNVATWLLETVIMSCFCALLAWLIGKNKFVARALIGRTR